MAQRPVYIPSESNKFLVETVMIDFEWFPGMSTVQKQKSIESLHSAAKSQKNNLHELLEVSSKSKTELGVNLSAFNLSITDQKRGMEFSVEAAFQSSKVFEAGGPYLELLNVSAREAKKDERLKTSGRLINFQFYNQVWPLEPKTAFYDYLYVNALIKHKKLHEDIFRYSAFTDIEFNPKKSINCQAYSVALFSSLHQRGLLNEDELRDKDYFLNLVARYETSNANNQGDVQPELI